MNSLIVPFESTYTIKNFQIIKVAKSIMKNGFPIFLQKNENQLYNFQKLREKFNEKDYKNFFPRNMSSNFEFTLDFDQLKYKT